MTDRMIDWPNKCCAKCRKPLVYVEDRYRGEAGYAGWRLDCICWDELDTVTGNG